MFTSSQLTSTLFYLSAVDPPSYLDAPYRLHWIAINVTLWVYKQLSLYLRCLSISTKRMVRNVCVSGPRPLVARVFFVDMHQSKPTYLIRKMENCLNNNFIGDNLFDVVLNKLEASKNKTS